MESTERLVRTWMALGRDEEVVETVSEISQGGVSLVDIVKALGEYLTSEDDELRRKGVEFLSKVLAQCPVGKLNRQSARVLTAFYCGKLDDIETIIPALKGLVILVRLPSFTSLDATTVIQSLFCHVKMKALVQSVRFTVYTIVDTLMAHHRDALLALGKDFINGYINLAEGEKDPRNLVVAFAIARVILIEFDISEHVESMFNIIFCYFPITFRPPPNDPYGISTDDLRLALRGCLNANPAFGPLAIPVFLEKLTAGSRTTKRDTLQALASCLPVYGSALARSTARKLWNAFKLEIFQPTDAETEVEALKTTQVLVNTIYAEQENSLESDEDIQGLARDACEECIQILREPEKSQAKPATRILCAFITTTPSVSRYTLSQAVPHLVKLFLNPDEILSRPAILVLLSDFIVAARDSFTRGSVMDNSEPLLLPYKDEVLGVFLVGLKNSSSRIQALEGLSGLIGTPRLLSDEEVGFVVHNINEVMAEDDSADASDSILDLLSSISAISPRRVEEQTLPLLFSSLPDTSPPRDAAVERAKYFRVLSALNKLCAQPELFETLVVRLTTKLDLICVPTLEENLEVDLEPAAAYAHALLKTITSTLFTKVHQGHPDVAKYVDRLLPRVYNLFIYSALAHNPKAIIATDPRLVKVAGELITLVTQSLPQQKQESYVACVFDAFLNGNIKAVSEGHQKVPINAKLCPFENSAPTSQKNLVNLFAAAVIPLHKEVKLPVPELGQFLDMMLNWSLVHSENELQRESIWHLIASIVNKRVDDIADFLNDKLNVFWSIEIANAERSTEARRFAISAWIWMTKALLVRSHASASAFTDKLFECFGDANITWDVAKAIGEVASGDSVLTKYNHAVIRILYAQKYVNAVLPRIVTGAKNASNEKEQTASLVALTALIKSIPKAAYAYEMSSLIPLLIRGLDLPDNNIRSNVIDTFLTTAEGDSPDKSLVAEHASTLVHSMVKNCVVVEMPSTRVRIAALRYLGILPRIVRYDILHPYKSTVLRELSKVLDDPKRSVRKEAVDARTAWFKYNG
ncbi:Dos2-interacting transcription regulator of RNA-Pol-II-domain-containing protein [Crucibulum laeve]|uniref:MMS19 nucleotide excision repair protein n=1 Tax=Crucibulum laeve TaxID=68775 RepID=A0A5C3M4W7_9AGAR|nr:Dos2-interacting transcription regulator of RNA-Pol-II-domain-containing protein [Crucibulum laeve]